MKNLFEAAKLELNDIIAEIKFFAVVALFGIIPGMIARCLHIKQIEEAIIVAIVVDTILFFILVFVIHYKDASKYAKENNCSFKKAWEATKGDCCGEDDY